MIKSTWVGIERVSGGGHRRGGSVWRDRARVKPAEGFSTAAARINSHGRPAQISECVMKDRRFFALFATAALVLGSCGKSDAPGAGSEIKTYQKEESRSLKAEATGEKPPPTQAEEAAAKAAEEKLTKKLTALLLGAGDDSIDVNDALAKISELGARAAGAVPEITKRLSHEDAEIRAGAVQALAKIQGTKARAAVEKALGDDAAEVRTAAVESWRLVAPEAWAPLTAMLKDFDAGVQGAAMEALKGAKLDDATIADIAGRLNDLEGEAVVQAVPLLVARKAAVPGFEDKMIVLLKHRTPGARVAAIKAVYEQDMKTLEIVRILARNLGDDEEAQVRNESIGVLRRWCGNDAPAYDESAEEEDRRSAAADWKAWVEANKVKFQ
jgi:HEAT repeat protein